MTCDDQKTVTVNMLKTAWTVPDDTMKLAELVGSFQQFLTSNARLVDGIHPPKKSAPEENGAQGEQK